MIVALSGAPAFDAGHAQLGANRSDPLPGGPPSPLPPTLEDPEPNAQVRVQYPVTFRWRAPLSSAEALGAPPPPDHHRLCVVETGGSCQSPSAVVREVKETILSLRLPPALHDKVLDWTVAACWAQKSASGVAFDCAWAAPRKLAVGAATVAIPYPPPRLGSPSPFDGPLRLDPKRPTTVVFRWRPPVSLRESAAGAPDPERYRLCVMEEGSSCDAPGALVYDVGKATLYNVPIPPSFAGKRIAWTAAACGPGYGAVGAQAGVPNADCTWAQPVVVPSETATATTN
jgi:hypothetical protein